MAHAVLVVHGAGEPRRREGKVYWEPLLGHALGVGFTVRAPRMPHPTRPTYRSWARRIAALLAEADSPALVGHSFGASVVLKHLATVTPHPSLSGLFLVATPFWGPDFPEFVLPADFGARLGDLAPIYLYHSRDDADVSFTALERYGRALPHAILRPLEGRGHEFDQPEFPELVGDIRDTATRRRAV